MGREAFSQPELLGLADDKENMRRKHHVGRNSVLT